MGAKRKRYTPAYRRDAAHLVIDTGRTIVEVAREIGVGEALLGRWVAAERARMEDPPGSPEKAAALPGAVETGAMAIYAGGGGEVPDALWAWVNARSPEAAREIFHRHEAALRSQEASKWIEATVAGSQDPRNRRIVSARFTLLGRSLEQGVDVALAGLPRMHDLIMEFLEADSYNRQKLIVLEEPALLTDEAQVWLSFLIVIQNEEDTEQYLLESWRILEEARTDVDAAFAGRIQQERGVIPVDVFERYMQEPDPAKQELILRAYPLLRSMVTHILADPEESQLGRQFDDFMRRL